jgi:hypothetical protein
VNSTLTVTTKVHFGVANKGALKMRMGHAPDAPASGGRIPKLARLMALAIRFESLLKAGDVADYAELARRGHVSRARITQITNLLMLAPEIQEAILFMPPVEQGRDPLKEWQVRPIAAEMNWGRQRRMWAKLSATLNQ